ncbi:MAG: LysM peptidoglycan-binding domain-containing M23 family metallopeptidase [Hyalangium sp.]|uniref:LysM peptidoglycan-binding domain-containing M23 family metallopeptidase n=1 Tax=Hyalangium sp. TaxID=2028555 RepID=UPI00389B0D2C
MAPAAPAVLPITLREAHPEPELITVRHKVAPGETAFRIARTYGITVEELTAANGIKDPRSITVGQELLIPTVEPEQEPSEPHLEWDVAPAAGGEQATRPAADTESSRPVAGREELPPRPRTSSHPVSPRTGGAASRPEPATKGMLDWPLRGVLYGRFGKKGREPHDGIDLAAPAGTPVKTAQEGTVLYAGEQRGYGLIVIVQHPTGLITLYAHNRDLRVKTGQGVRRSQVIATVGESGRTSGPHLHFEVRVDGKPVDPGDYLGPLPSS